MTKRDTHSSDGEAPPARGAIDTRAPLDADEIRSLLDTAGRATFRDITVLESVDSTNRWLGEHLEDPRVRNGVCLAEQQSAGRGRRGREWCSPPGGNIYMSVGWRFDREPAALAGLGLVAGVVVATAIGDEGIPGIELKWPNDLLAGSAKVGGVLVECRSQREQATTAVIGLGINIALTDSLIDAIDQPVTDLARVAGAPVNRTHIVARVINGFADALPRFAVSGLAPFRHRWSVLDRTCDSDVMIDDGSGARAGHAVGIDDDGALLVQTTTGVERVHAADVRLRVTT